MTKGGSPAGTGNSNGSRRPSRMSGPGARALDGIDFAENLVTGSDILSGATVVHATYYWEDAGGRYCYETLPGFIYGGTEKVYVSGPREGEREPAFFFWMWLKVKWKAIFDRPTIYIDNTTPPA